MHAKPPTLGDLEIHELPSARGCTIGRLADLSSHAIVDRGRLVGVWEFDTATESILWLQFVGRNAALTGAVERTQEYIRTQLGDARSFSLDSLKSREPRLAALRTVAHV